MSTRFFSDLKINEARFLIDNYERVLRLFIEEELNKYYHENWWESGIPQPIRNRVSNQLHEKKKREPKKTFKKIEECTFNDYESIIFNNRNWDKIFKKTFHEKSYIRYPLTQLRYLRNDLSHGRKLSNKDYRKINTYIDDILRYIPSEITLEDLMDINEEKGHVTEAFLSYFEENIENKIKIRQTKPSIATSLNDDDDETILSRKKTTPALINTPLMHKTQTTPPTPNITQTTLPIITTDRILNVLTDEWQTIKHLIFKLKIKDMMDARYLQLKLKELERKGEVLVEAKMGRKQWKLK